MGDSADTTSPTFTLTRDNARDLRFQGKLIGKVSSSGFPEDCMQEDESLNAFSCRWTELELYRAEHGAWIVASIGRSTFTGELDHHAAYVCSNENDLIGALEEDNDGGLGWLSKELLAKAGIEAVETLENRIEEAPGDRLET